MFAKKGPALCHQARSFMRTPRIVAIDEKRERALGALQRNFVDGYYNARGEQPAQRAEQHSYIKGFPPVTATVVPDV
jgi:hypothetical protein